MYIGVKVKVKGRETKQLSRERTTRPLIYLERSPKKPSQPNASRSDSKKKQPIRNGKLRQSKDTGTKTRVYV